MRYTEARLEKFTEEVYLKDLDKTVNFVPNYDETEKEPEVLPVRVPNLLINGAEGIAVGMSTSIPPHNLGEVIDAVKAYIANPEITTEELLRYMPGRISRQAVLSPIKRICWISRKQEPGRSSCVAVWRWSLESAEAIRISW